MQMRRNTTVKTSLREPYRAGRVCQWKKEIRFSDIYYDSTEDHRFEMLVTGPAADSTGALYRVIAFEVDMTPVYSLIQDLTGLGATGEVLVGRKIGNQVAFLNPLRHDPGPPLKEKRPSRIQAATPSSRRSRGRPGRARQSTTEAKRSLRHGGISLL